MRVLRSIRSLEDPRPHVLTLGSFDGVHRGHQAIIGRAVAHARRLEGIALAVTFHPHPVAVLAPEHAPALLGGLRLRLEQLGAEGIDVVVAQHFTRRFSQLSAEDFIREHLVRKLNVQHVVVGYNVGFGHRRQGNADLLRRFGAELGFAVEVVEAVHVGGDTVSSSAIRAAVGRGDLDRAANMLGRPYMVTGHVRTGFRRGQQIGFPTANLLLHGIQLPPDGVYAVRVRIGTAEYGGVANLGFNPTFGNERRTLESHLFDFTGDLYGKRIDVAFLHGLRGEMKFAGIDELRAQIAADAAAARTILAGPGPS